MIELSCVYFAGHVLDNKFSAAPACTPDRPSIAIASLFVLIATSSRARRLAPTLHPFMFALGYNGDDLHDAYRDVAVLQKLYDIAEFKAALAISLMEEAR
jgi:hypothetical protein